MKIDAKLTGDIRNPEKGQVFYRDDELVGFAIRATSGATSYIVECRVNGNLRRVTLGRLGQLSPEQARQKAQATLSGMASQRVHVNTRIPTLTEVLEDYVNKKRLLSGEHHRVRTRAE